MSACAEVSRSEHHALTIAGGPYGPLGRTHVFPRPDGLGVLLAGLVDGAAGCAFRNVSVDPGGYYRGDGEISPPVFSPAELERLKKIKTWNDARKWLRARRSRPSLDEYIRSNPELVKETKRKTRERDYLNNEFIAVDFEGQDSLGNVIERPNGTDRRTPYDDHQLFMAGAASIDKTRPPEWLINPESTDTDKKPLDPRALLEWLVSLPERYGKTAIFVMYSFSYDVTHILRHLRFEKAWEIFKGEKYDKDRAKRRKIRSRTFCGEPFDEFLIKYRHRKQLDIWKLHNPKQPYLRDENGIYVLDKNGFKQLDTIAHITLFDTHPFFQQSFVKAVEFLVEVGKAERSDFDFMKEMKAKRDRFATETLDQIKYYTELELRYLAMAITELRKILHEIKLKSAPDMKPIHLSNWYGPGAVASAMLKNLGIVKNHYGDHVRAIDPSPVQIAAHHAFSAGNIQLMKVGHAPDLDLHSMDIASAYPHALTQQPSLAGGQWNEVDSGIRYQSLAELKAIIKASPPVSMFSPNSIYGKMAQRVGGSLTKDGWKAPPTANPYYAAAITANCRRRLRRQ
jgi:hypothetical protein